MTKSRTGRSHGLGKSTLLCASVWLRCKRDSVYIGFHLEMVRLRDMTSAFKTLLDAQIELNSFISQSADAFSFDDGIEFVRTGERALEIAERDASVRAAWERDGRKLDRLHGYWLYRALDEFVHSDRATATIGLPENHEANRLAYIRAIRTRLQLTEVYGLDEAVTTDSGVQVDLFQTLLATELMSAFYQRDFLHAFVSHFNETGHWAAALSVLALGGFATGENRLPLTWSDRKAKIARIVGWTVSDGSARDAPTPGSKRGVSRSNSAGSLNRVDSGSC